MSRFAPPPPPEPPKREPELPPHTAPSVESWKQPVVMGPQNAGPPALLVPLLVAQCGMAFFQLYQWVPEELVIPACPPIQALYAFLVAYYVYKGKNAARMLAMIGAGAWVVGAMVVMGSRTDLLNAIPRTTRMIVMIRAVFEVLFAFVLSRPDAVAYFERKR